MKNKLVVMLLLLVIGTVAYVQNNDVTNTFTKVNQENPNQVVKAYFSYAQNKDFLKAKELTYKRVNFFGGLDSIELKSLNLEGLNKGGEYLQCSASFKVNGATGGWHEGENFRFVGLRMREEKWYISELSTGP